MTHVEKKAIYARVMRMVAVTQYSAWRAIRTGSAFTGEICAALRTETQTCPRIVDDEPGTESKQAEPESTQPASALSPCPRGWRYMGSLWSASWYHDETLAPNAALAAVALPEMVCGQPHEDVAALVARVTWVPL
jgi:hypothetical protein